MSKFDKRRNRKKIKFDNWFEINIIKIRVVIVLIFFNKTSIERENVDEGIINELQTWSTQKEIKFSVKKINKQVYIRGQHSIYQTSSFRHYQVLFFSK